MNRYLITILLSVLALEVQAQTYTIQNPHIARTLQVVDGTVSTRHIHNRKAQKYLRPLKCDEFILAVSTDNLTELQLTNKDFTVTSVEKYVNPEHPKSKGYCFQLHNIEHDLYIKVYYELSDHDVFCRKHIEIKSNRNITLKKIDVEAISFEDAVQNYSIKKITAKGYAQWKPGLGQPIYTTQTSTFWGIEFPASRNEVKKQQITCGYLYRKTLMQGDVYNSYNSVIGVSDSPHFIDDAFYSYIDKIRKRPLRLQIQYNSWFDYAENVSEDKFTYSVEKINRELITKRGCTPLDAYIIDDGWQDVSKATDWSQKVWTVNNKFHPNFTKSFQAVQQIKSQLGLWLSPASILGAQSMVPRMKEYGFEALSFGMSMTGETYMQKLEDRILELAQMGVSYFKFDGLFGHLVTRDFDLENNPFPSSNDERLNDSRFDEQKELYLVEGTERLIQVFDKLDSVNPDVFTAITNGAYLSPWWLQHIDIVWLINAGDAAKGNDRTGELVYRDLIYHQIWKEENTKFPMCAIFNHEPKKTQSSEIPEAFKNYLYMNLSRGTGFIELYIKTDSLSSSDWDILAEGLKWAEKSFPAFRYVRMHGGSPRLKEVYGYSAWSEKQGYISLHNPSDYKRSYTMKLNRKLGVYPQKGVVFHLSSPTTKLPQEFIKEYQYGDTLSIELCPREVAVLDFSN